MSERERWVVYPLLFLALGAALRDKLIDRTITKSIVCQELNIVDEEPLGNQPVRILARFGRDPASQSASGVALMVNGHARVEGDLAVDGTLNAKQYAYKNIPFIPAGTTIPDWLRALQQQQQRGQIQRVPNSPKAQAPGKQSLPRPPAKDSKEGSNAAPPSQADDPSGDEK